MLVCKYIFDNSIYDNLIPAFNSGYEGYTITDEVNGSYTTRTIESDTLPTLMRFGSNLETYVEGSEVALLEILDMNTSELTTTYRMFRRCSNLSNINCNWNTSKVTNMYGMVSNCNSLTSLDLTNFNTQNVTNMSYMFNGCSNLIKLDLSDFDTSKVTNISNMFDNCTKLQYIKCNNQSTINTISSLLPTRTSDSQGTIICKQSDGDLQLIDMNTLSSKNWNVTNETEIIATYVYDTKIYSNLIPTFNSGYVYFVEQDIDDEDGIRTRTLEGLGLPTSITFGTSSQTNESLSLLKLLYMNIDNFTELYRIFDNCRNLTYINCKDWDTKNIKTMYCLFRYCTNLTELDVSNWDMGNVTTVYHMFNNCNKLTSLDVSNWNTSNVTTMQSMFAYCTNLTTLDVSNFNTSKVTNMQSMFYNCNNLTQLDVSNFNTSKVTTTFSMFNNCTNLTQLDVSNWDTSNVTTMYHMFYNCNKLTKLDLSNFNTSNVTNMAHMFNNCNKLTSLDLSNFDTSKVTNFTDMFINTSLLTDIGMLYCSQDTINTIIPLITSGNKTIWVKDTKASDYTNTSYVTIKDYEENKRTYKLTSPLLQGDEIVTKDGKTYHYHKMGKVVLDGSEHWKYVAQYGTAYRYDFEKLNLKPNKTTDLTNANFINNRFKVIKITTENTEGMNIHSIDSIIQIQKNGLNTLEDFSQWLQQNPTTVVYELIEPYYELLSDEPLELQTFNNQTPIETNEEIIPTKVKANNVGFNTIIKANTTYTVSLNTTPNGVDLGGTYLVPTSNVFTIKTPTTLAHNNLYLYGEGVVVNSVMLLEGNVMDYVPQFFEGMMSSFEENLVTNEKDEHYGKYEVEIKSVGQNESNRQVLYLNSPLLQGDEIVSIDGKLCHYHKMGMVVLDGSEDEGLFSTSSDYSSNNFISFGLDCSEAVDIWSDPLCGEKVFSNNFITKTGGGGVWNGATECITTDGNRLYLCIAKTKLQTIDLNGFKQWLQANPTTVVYELVNPYYEEIEFDMSKILLESYYNGHLQYNTLIPLASTEVNYSADIPLVNALLEQAEIQDQQDAMILENTVALAMINLLG